MYNKMKKGRSKSRKEHKSVDVVNGTKGSEESRKMIPKMTEHQTTKLLTRLTGSSIARQADYGKVVDNKLQELKAKCQKLFATIELLQLMNSNQQTVRCLQHNNALTLYCLTEQKALCVNCTYSELRHRTHRVLPLKDAITHLAANNQTLEALLDDHLLKLQENVRTAQNNLKTLKYTQKKALNHLQEQHSRARAELDRKFEAATDKITQKFSTIMAKTHQIQTTITEFKQKVEGCLSMIGVKKYGGQMDGQHSPLNQQVYSSIFANLIKYDFHPIDEKQLQRLTSDNLS